MANGHRNFRGEKRKREQREGQEMLGLGATVSLLAADKDDGPKDLNSNSKDMESEQDKTEKDNRHEQAGNEAASEEKDQGEWQTVGPSKKRQKKEKAQYPNISHANNARVNNQVKLGDLQNLILYILADGYGPQWISVRHKLEIERVVCVLVPGLEADMFEQDAPAVSVAAENGNETENGNDTENGKKTENGNDKENAMAALLTKIDTQLQQEFKTPAKDGKYQTPDDYYPKKLIADNLSPSLSPLADIFTHVWPVKTPGEFSRMHSPLYAILTAPIPKPKEDKKIKGPKPPNVGKDFKSQRTPITEYIATKDELTENGFSLHPAHLHTQQERDFEAARRHKNCRGPEDGWIDLPEDLTSTEPADLPFADIEAGSITAGRNLLFLDCEMVSTKMDKFALARLSILDWNGELILDELVQPPDPVIDYLTPYSGISKEMLDPITTTLADIQAKLRTLLTPRTILAGHSLDSDLRALKISFPFIVDTTLLYPHPKGPPQKSSLKWLSQKYLSREIQHRGPQGHDSIEDARACLDLVKQKCEKGKTWGTAEATGESIFKRLARSTRSADPSDSEGKTGAVVDWGDPRKGYGSFAAVAIPCENDDDVVAGVKRVVCGPAGPGLSDEEIIQCVEEDIPRNGVDFTWARLRELEAMKGWWNKTKSRDAAERLAKTIACDENNEKEETNGEIDAVAVVNAVAKTVSKIKDMYDALPPKTAFMVYTGSGDPRDMRRLSEMQAEFKKAYQTMKWDELPVKWTDVEEQALKKAANKARSGLGFVTCK